MDKFDYPIPEKSLRKVSEKVIKAIGNNACITCLFIHGTGRKTIPRFLLKEENILKNALGDEYKKTLFIYVDPNNLLRKNNEAYLQLILDALTEKILKLKLTPIRKKNSNSFILIKNNLELLTKKKFNIVFILHDFCFTLELEPTIFRNLEAIMTVDKSRINFILLARINILEKETLLRFDYFKYAVTQSVYYHHLFNEEEIDFILEGLQRKIKDKFSASVRKLLFEFSGGHPQLAKYGFYTLLDTGKEYIIDPIKAKKVLLQAPQLRTICEDIWECFNKTEKKILINVVRTNNIHKEMLDKANYLLNTGIVHKNKNKYIIFNEIFTNYISNLVPKEKLFYDENLNQIFLGLENVSDKFTFQEFKLMTHFLKNEGKVISRDEVGQVIWGKNYIDKFSDWSIDKLISVLRKQFEKIDFPPNNLQTLKKRGFTFSNSK